MDTERENLRQLIENGLRVKKKDIDAVLKMIDAPELSDKLTGKFYIVRCTPDEIREADLIKTLKRYLLHFCLPQKRVNELSPESAAEIVEEAVGKLKSTGSEIGELILYCLLETQENAVQIINKMPLKTSAEVPFHGRDAVHFGERGNLLAVYFGEAKMWKDFDAALKDALSDFENFYKNETLKNFEVSLIKSHIDSEKFQGKEEAILKYLNPYEKDKGDLTEVVSIFIGYSWNDLGAIDPNESGLEKQIIEKYKVELRQLMTAIAKKIEVTSHLKEKRLLVFVIPFKDVEHIRKAFVERESPVHV